MGSTGKQSNMIATGKNSFGQTIYRPRSAYEDRIREIEETERRVYEQANAPAHRRQSIDPQFLRKLKEEKERLKKALKTGSES